jgi:hypothetical protein
MPSRKAVGAFLHNSHIPCLNIVDNAFILRIYMVFREADLPEGAVIHTAEELLEELNEDYILPSGTEFFSLFNGKKLVVNNEADSLTDLKDNGHKVSYHALELEDKFYRYSDFPVSGGEINPESLYVKCTEKLRSTVSRVDITNYEKDEFKLKTIDGEVTNYLPSNSSFSHRLNLKEGKLNARRRELSYYDTNLKPWLLRLSQELLDGWRYFNQIPTFHIYTGDEPVSLYREASFFINYGPAGYWCNYQAENITMAEAREIQAFRDMEARIRHEKPVLYQDSTLLSEVPIVHPIPETP